MLALAWVQTRKILDVVGESPSRGVWHALHVFMAVFVFAYGVAAALLWGGYTEILTPLSTAILLLGAVFVLLVVRLGFRTLMGFQDSSRELERELEGRETAIENLRASESAVADANVRMAELYTELEELHEQAVAATQAKTDFLARMSHELRTPLNAILGFAELSKRRGLKPEERDQHLDIILNSGNHLLQLINDILDISKIEAGQMSLQEEVFELRALLRETVAMFQPRAADKRIALELVAGDELPAGVVGDARRLQQVLINLVNNAIKFTDEGRVSLRVEGAPDGDSHRLRFEVRDTGQGIGAHELATLFEPFTQTETGKRAKSGTGLGLAICHEFVSLMGGELTVESERGVGTRFRFELRVTAAEIAAPRAAASARKVIGLRRGQPERRVLIADDQPVNRLLLRHLLEPRGFALREASDGLEAVALARQWAPHVVLMDIRMPRLDGFAATRQIKAALEPAPVVIALTAGVFGQELAEIEAAGCDAVLGKPFEASKLLEILALQLDISWEYESTPAIAAGQ